MASTLEADLKAVQEAQQRVLGAQQKLQSEKDQLIAAGDQSLESTGTLYVCVGPINFETNKHRLFTCYVEGWFLYPPETHWGKVKFQGDLDGAGIGDGHGIGMFLMGVSRDELLGDVSCEFHFGGVGPGLYGLNMWRGPKLFGTSTGGCVTKGGFAGGGTLKFERM